ncbi:MAG: sulfatase [Candidatus Latescibacteria bacterium]|nr:sulfatase [Candidatus Latescibacterota bacterium]
MKRSSRRSFIKSAAGIGAGSLLSKQTFAQEKRPEFTGPLTKEKLPDEIITTKPNGLNIIVIIADTFRWDYLGYNGNSRIQTPNLDALAKAGVYFENCYADGLPTIPARRVIHTGNSILPDKNKWRPLEKTDITFAEIVGKAGFTSGFVVDTFHHFKPDMNLHRGFDNWIWIRGQESDPYKSGPRNSVNPADYAPKHLLNEYFHERIVQYILNTKDRKSEDDYFCAQSCSAAAHWLEENKDNDGPFMLFIDMFDPHEPWDAPPRFKKMYRNKFPFERYIFGYGVNLEDIREDDIPLLIDLYSAEVTFSDYCIGRLLDDVKRLGLWDNTIIAFSTDHGTHLGEQGCVQKQAKLLNSCIGRVPLIIRHPQDRTSWGKRVDALTSHMDYLPTFLSLLGVDTNIMFDGRNMWDLVTGTEKKLRDYAITGYGNFGSIHNHEWHYLQNVWGDNPGLGPQLYDLKKDFGEEKNVVSSNQTVVNNLKKILNDSFKV